jgi:anaerobic glycerol-3-phosphate dehydrogenase
MKGSFVSNVQTSIVVSSNSLDLLGRVQCPLESNHITNRLTAAFL